jgi:hypothetical protein
MSSNANPSLNVHNRCGEIAKNCIKNIHYIQSYPHPNPYLKENLLWNYNPHALGNKLLPFLLHSPHVGGYRCEDVPIKDKPQSSQFFFYWSQKIYIKIATHNKWAPQNTLNQTKNKEINGWVWKHAIHESIHIHWNGWLCWFFISKLFCYTI